MKIHIFHPHIVFVIKKIKIRGIYIIRSKSKVLPFIEKKNEGHILILYYFNNTLEVFVWFFVFLPLFFRRLDMCDCLRVDDISDISPFSSLTTNMYTVYKSIINDNFFSIFFFHLLVCVSTSIIKANISIVAIFSFIIGDNFLFLHFLLFVLLLLFCCS